jgi:hypothetical protein
LHNSPNDTNSAPYVVYDGDFIYVGDDSGNLHKFTGVFSGNPAEVVSGTAPIWPVSVTSTAGKLILTSPVFDPVSGNIFVADEGGFLYSYSASAATRVMKSSQLTYASGTVGIVDSPLVDSSTGKVYVFVGDDANTASNVGCDNGTGCTGVFQFSATLTGTGTGGSGGCDATSTSSWNGATSCGVEAVFGVGTTTTPTTYDGAFDQIYYNGSGASGNLWVCAPHAGSTPRLAFVTMQSGGSIVSSGVLVVGNTAILALASAQATCSPVTEVYGSNGGTNDYIFLSVSGSSSLSATGCGTGNACAYNFLVGNGVTESTPSNATAGIIEAGGTSGIIIDNNLATASGESQIYFTSLANATCAGNGTTGSGSGGCAVQASQTAP